MSAVLRALGALLCALLVGMGAAACGSGGSDAAGPSSSGSSTASSEASRSTGGSRTSDAPKPSARPKPSGSAASSTKGSAAAPGSTSADVPQRVRDTLAHIDAGDWPDAANAPGTHGGDSFGNREGRLPAKSDSGKSVRYREWDVNPKKSGQGRDAERIITGDDGSAWFTLDHYDHFTRIR